MQNSISEQLIIFPWTLRWLKGHEYFHIINNYLEYSKSMGFELVDEHPLWIYNYPESKYKFNTFFSFSYSQIDGRIYFLKIKQNMRSLQKVGFPRVKLKKKLFKWRKMNFETLLPKHNPLVIIF